jgi:hypothetical protein
MTTDPVRPAAAARPPLHHLARTLDGMVALPLPLCWDADAIQRHGRDYDTDLWFLSWDQGAIDPTRLLFATSREHVTCPGCAEWLHA